MKKNTKRRVALLSALLVAGLVLAGLGTAFGAGAVFQEETPLRLEAISEGGFTKIVVFGDGEEIETLNVSEAGAFSIVTSTLSGEIRIESEPRLVMVGTYTAGDIYTKLSEEQRCKAIEIAKRNETVQGILEGAENYHITVYDVMKMEEIEKEGKGRGIKLVHEEDKARVEIRVFNEYEDERGLKEYSVIVDLAKEEVTEINEVPEIRKAGIAWEGNLSELRLEIITCEKNLTEEEKARAKEIALSDSRVQERIEGKEYEIKAINAHMLSQITGECELLGASVFIDLPEIDKWFNVNVDLEEGKVTHISPLIPIPKLLEEQ